MNVKPRLFGPMIRCRRNQANFFTRNVYIGESMVSRPG